MGLSSQQVLDFIPLDTWTYVFIIPGYKSNNNGTFLISTKEKYLKRCKVMYEMAVHSHTFEKVSAYKLMGLVAVEIEGLWCRGRMLSYNEFVPKNTVIELIDSGTIVKKQLCDLYLLPDCYEYDPFCLAIKPINEISYPKFGKLYVKPLLTQSELHKDYVLVNTKLIDTINELHSEKNFDEINVRKPLSLSFNTKDIGAIQKSDFNMQGDFSNSVIQTLYKSNHLNFVEKQEEQSMEYIIECSNELLKVYNRDKCINFKNVLEIASLHGLKNIFTELMTKIPKCLFLKSSVSPNHLAVMNNAIEYKQNSIVPDSYINDFKTSECLFKNGSLIQFCYGTNIDFVYIRNYEQKQKFNKEMKQFYSYYEKKENLKIKKNINNGDMVAALLTRYKETHRAVILHKDLKNNVVIWYLCFFVDIGCKEYVKFNHIFELLEEAKHVPFLAHKVGLNNTPFHNTMKLKYLKNYFDELYLQSLIIEYDESDPNGLNKVVLKNQCNMNISLEAEEYIVKKFSEFQSNNDDSNSKISDYLNYNDLFKNGTTVVVTSYQSVNQIYVRINSYELQEYYNLITTEVDKFYENNKSAYNRKLPRVGEKVAVNSLSMNKFVRAIILKKINDLTYLVNRIDYGDTEYINTNNIFVLPYVFRHLPQSVIRIGLNVSLSINQIKNLNDYFNQLIQSSVPLIAEFDEEDPHGFQRVVLKKQLNGVNIFEEIGNIN